jgi:hypothetical protein
MLLRYMCTACAWEASGADSGKFREISAPAAPLANFSLNFAKLWDTPIGWLGRVYLVVPLLFERLFPAVFDFTPYDDSRVDERGSEI